MSHTIDRYLSGSRNTASNAKDLQELLCDSNSHFAMMSILTIRYTLMLCTSDSPLLHVVDEATRFQAAKWLRNMSSQHVWNTLQICWIDVYLGPPDMINHDAGRNFVSSEFQQYAKLLAFNTKETTVETANTIGIVERYHKPLRRAYEIIKEEINLSDTQEQRELVLQMAVKAVNDIAG
ncbi:hypothetical protein K3495_g12800 [Podosphaera aphanis]|nr:hypothetical protein K3495_g12800 [Podosphaera aphanis]